MLECACVCMWLSVYFFFFFVLVVSEVIGEARPYHGKEAVDPRQGRARGGDATHFHTVNVAQPVRFSSKLQACLAVMLEPMHGLWCKGFVCQNSS